MTSQKVKDKINALIEKASKRGATRAVVTFVHSDIYGVTEEKVNLLDGRSILLTYLNQPELKVVKDFIEGILVPSQPVEKDKNKDEYQGWPNRETWAMALHIDNDQGLYNQTYERVRDIIRNIGDDEAVRDRRWTRDEAILFRTEDDLKDWMEELRLEALDNPGQYKEALKMFDDIGSFWRIEWKDVAEHYLQDVRNEDEFKTKKNPTNGSSNVIKTIILMWNDGKEFGEISKFTGIPYDKVSDICSEYESYKFADMQGEDSKEWKEHLKAMRTDSQYRKVVEARDAYLSEKPTKYKT